MWNSEPSQDPPKTRSRPDWAMGTPASREWQQQAVPWKEPPRPHTVGVAHAISHGPGLAHWSALVHAVVHVRKPSGQFMENITMSRYTRTLCLICCCVLFLAVFQTNHFVIVGQTDCTHSWMMLDGCPVRSFIFLTTSDVKVFGG